jgi:hypothetical protein
MPAMLNIAMYGNVYSDSKAGQKSTRDQQFGMHTDPRVSSGVTMQDCGGSALSIMEVFVMSILEIPSDLALMHAML